MPLNDIKPQAPLSMDSTVVKKDSYVEDINKTNATALAVTQASAEGDSFNLEYQKNFKDQLSMQGLADTSAPVIHQFNENILTEYNLALSDLNQEAQSQQEIQDNQSAMIEAATNDLAKPDGFSVLRSAMINLGMEDTKQNQYTVSSMIAAQVAAEMGTTDGVFDTVSSFLGLMIPGRDILDTIEMGAALPEVKGLNVQGLERAYAALDPAEQVANLPAIRQFVESKTDNPFLRQQYFEQITGANDQSFLASAAISGGLEIGGELLGGGLLTAAGKYGVRWLKGTKPLKVMKTAGKEGVELSGKLNAEAINNPEAADAVGEALDTVQGNTTGWKLEGLFPNQTDGIAASTVEAIDRKVAAVEEKLGQVNLKGHNLFTSKERETVKAKWVDDFKSKYLEAGDGLEPTQYAADDVSFDIKDTLTGFKVTVRTPDATYHIKPIRFTNLDAGNFAAEELSMTGDIFHKIASPNSLLRRFQDNMVSQATTLDRQASSNVKALTEAARRATKGLGKKSSSKIDEILLAGDNPGAKNGVVFTPQQLMLEGIDTPAGTVKLTEKEAAAYYGLRRVFDDLFKLEDTRVARELEFQGFKRLDFNIDDAITDTFQAFAQPINKFDDGVSRVYSATRKSIINISEEEIQKGLEDGTLQRVKFKNPVKVTRGANEIEWVDHGVVSVDDLRDIGGGGVLNYRHGYVPLIRKNAHFFVRRGVDTTVSGVKKKIFKTERIFNTEIDAKAWAEAQDNADELVVAADRELSSDVALREEQDYVRMGGLYGSTRVQRQLLYGLEGTTPVRLSAIDALKRNLAHAAHTSTFNEFRMSAMAKFKRTYGPDGLNILAEPGDVLNSRIISKKGEVVRAAKLQQEYLRHILRIPTRDETLTQSTWRRIASLMEGSDWLKDSKVRDAALDMRSKDPFTLLKTVTFHAMLGMYNPSQLVVQASGALPAMAMRPHRVVPLLAHYNALRSAMYVRRLGNKEGVGIIADKLGDFLSKTGGLSKDDFVKLVDDFNETGIMDSVRTNADYDAMLNSFDADRSAISRIFDSGLYFYREGELFTRTYGWLMARDEYLAKFPAKRGKLTEFDKEKIMKRGQAVVLNMDRANAAWWQHAPVIGNATQFLQVHTKMLEAMAGKELSRADKWKFLLGSVATSGAKGFPFGTAALTAIASQYVDYGELDENTRTIAEDGAQGLLWYWLTGERVEAASRTSIVSGIEDTYNQWVTDDIGALDLMMGASGSIGSRALNAWRNSGAIIAPVFEDFSQFDQETVLDVTSEWAKIASSYNNATKAWMIYNLGHVTDSRGNLLFNTTEEERVPTAILRALGFTTTREYYNWVMRKDLTSLQKQEKAVADTLVALYRKYEGEFYDEDLYKRYRLAATLALRPFDGQPDVQARIQKAVNNRIWKGSERELTERIIHRSLEGTETRSSLFSPQTAPQLKPYDFNQNNSEQ
jgi:hypothetical protein